MATKLCDVCKRPIPKGQSSCPHCAAVERDRQEDLEALDVVELADDEVLEEIGPDDVVEVTDAEAESNFDFIPDEPATGRETLGAGRAETPAAGPSAGLPNFSLDDERARVDLSGKPTTGSPATDLHLVHDALDAEDLPEAEDAQEILEAAGVDEDDDAVVMEADLPTDNGSALDLLADEVESRPAVNRGEHPTSGSPSSRDFIAEAVESGVDIESPAAAAGPSAQAAREAREEAVFGELTGAGEDSSAVNLGSSANVDLSAGAEEESSAVDLGSSEAIDLPGLDDVDSSAVDLGSDEAIALPASEASDSSSAVDLGSSAVVEIPEEVMAEAEADEIFHDEPEPTRLQVPHLPLENSAPFEALGEVTHADPFETVDLPRRSHPTQVAPTGRTELARDDDMLAEMETGEVVDGEEVVAGEVVDEDVEAGEVVDEGEVVEEPPARPAKAGRKRPVAHEEEPVAAGPSGKKPARPKYLRRWIGGILVGGIAAAAACIGLWGAGIEPPAEVREMLGGKSPTTQKPNPQPAADPKVVAIADKLRQQHIDNPDIVQGVDNLIQLRNKGLEDVQQAKAAQAAAEIKLQSSEDKAKTAETNFQTADAKLKVAEANLAAVQSGGKIGDPISWLNHGDFDHALPELAKSDLNKVENQLARGKALWWQYSRDQKKAGKPLQKTDPPVMEAITLLTKASQQKSADALFWLGKIEEETGHLPEARALYQRGVTEFPDQKTLFQSQLDRTERSGDAQSRLPGPGSDVVLVATLLQAPDAKPEEEEEAAPTFFRSLKLAQQGNYTDALKALKEARDTHDKVRFTRLRKAQNPNTDPTEETFLRSCDELKMYWEVLALLKGSGYDPKAGPPKALNALIAELDRTRKDSATLKAVVAKFKEAKIDNPDVLKSFDLLTAQLNAQIADARKLAEDNAKKADANSQLALETQKKLDAESTRVKLVAARLTAAGIKEADLAKAVDQLAMQRNTNATQRDEAESTLVEVGKKVEVLMPPDSDPKGHATILKAVERLAREKFVDQLADTRKEVQRLGSVLAERHTPQEMLDYWLPLLRTQPDKIVLARADQDVRRVQADTASKPADKAKALYVQALALRGSGKVDEARLKLAEALNLPAAPDAAWRAEAARAQQELSDPTVYYMPTIQDLARQGKYPQALDLLGQALALFPNDSATLVALRGQLRLDQARDQAGAKGLSADDLALVAVRKDAEAAAAGGAEAEANYLLGQAAEVVNRLAEAEAAYRKAAEQHPADDLLGNRYRLAVARVLWKLNATRPVTPPAGPGRLGLLDGPAPRTLDVPALMTVLLQPDREEIVPGVTPELKEANELAKKVLASRATEKDFVLRAQALAIQGLWNEALMVYLEGVRPTMRRDYADVLTDLITHHPGFRVTPDTAAIPDPQTAEQHFAAGLTRYFNRDYAAAEREFLAAVKYEKQDARYFYFLGLTRWVLDPGDKGAAIIAFKEGSRLEKLSRPGREAINVTMERIQGPMRRVLDGYRP